MDLKRLTASDFIEAASRSERDGASKAAFLRLNKDLSHYPEIQQRLTFELLSIARQMLARKTDPWPLAMQAGIWMGSISDESLANYANEIEALIRGSFDLAGQSGLKAAGTPPFYLSLSIGLAILRSADQTRFQRILGSLRDRCTHQDLRRYVLAEAESTQSQQGDRIASLRKELHLNEARHWQHLMQSTN